MNHATEGSPGHRPPPAQEYDGSPMEHRFISLLLSDADIQVLLRRTLRRAARRATRESRGDWSGASAILVHLRADAAFRSAVKEYQLLQTGRPPRRGGNWPPAKAMAPREDGP